VTRPPAAGHAQYVQDQAVRPECHAAWIRLARLHPQVLKPGHGANIHPQANVTRLWRGLGLFKVHNRLVVDKHLHARTVQFQSQGGPLGVQNVSARFITPSCTWGSGPEVGWLAMTHDGSAQAQDWLGPNLQAVVYQWHYDWVSRPPDGARCLAGSPAWAVQAFAIGPHLGMQFHVEITAKKTTTGWSTPAHATPMRCCGTRTRCKMPMPCTVAQRGT